MLENSTDTNNYIIPKSTDLRFNLFYSTGDIQKLIQPASLKDPKLEKLKEVCWTLITFLSALTWWDGKWACNHPCPRPNQQFAAMRRLIIIKDKSNLVSWRDEG